MLNVLRWRVRPVDEPTRVGAELVFTIAADGDSGRLEIHADDPSMKVLVAYYLTDPRDMHPAYVHGLGYLHGPHTRSAVQLVAALEEFGRTFPAFFVEVVEDPTTVRPAASLWDALSAELRELDREQGVGGVRSLAAFFHALATGERPSVTTLRDAELLGTGRFADIPVPAAGEGGSALRRSVLNELLATFSAVDRSLRNAGAPACTPADMPDLPASLSARARAVGVLALAWPEVWALADGGGEAIDDDARRARLGALFERARAALPPWACPGDRGCGEACPSVWHLGDDDGENDATSEAVRAVALEVLAASLAEGGAARG